MFQTLSDKAAAVGNFVEDNTRFAEFLGAMERYGADQFRERPIFLEGAAP